MAVCALNRVVNRLGGLNASGGGAGASFVAGLRPAAWFRYGDGITSAGGLVSAWADQSGNARPLLQATGTNQPTLQADGSILSDGVDNFLKADAFTLNQPATFYFLGRQVTWTSPDRILDGNASDSTRLAQTGTTPEIVAFAGSSLSANTNFTLNAYAALCVVYNGASSVCQVNNTTPITGDAGANNPSGFTLGAIGDGSSAWSNIQVKEIVLFAAAHDAATRSRVIRYLSQVGQLGL